MSSSTTKLPSNVHVSTHPCIQGKLSLLRAKTANSREVKSLVHDISIILGCEAMATCITTEAGPKGETPLGFEYTTTEVQPKTMSLVPILRSGLGMVEAIQTLLPHPVAVHHLGLYREPTTLEPVEYYNNLPHHIISPPTTSNDPDHPEDASAPSLAIILDPVIATGGTCAAAIQTLKEWGAKRIVVLSVLGAVPGVQRAAAEWPEACEIWLAGVDDELTDSGMLQPGLGDVGDRLFLTIGK